MQKENPSVAADTTATQFPSVDLSNKQKDKAYHKAALLNYIKMTFFGNPFISYYNDMLTNYQYYFGTQELNNLFGIQNMYNVQGASFGQGQSEDFIMPTKVVNYNSIKPRIDLLMGEFINRGFDFEVKTVGIDVESERDAMKKRMIAKIRTKHIAESAAAITGFPIGLDGEMPKTEDDIQEYVDRTYRDILGEAVKECLKYSYQANQYEETRLRMGLDMWVLNRACAVRKVLNGRDVIQYVSPFNVFIDPNATGSHLQDARYFLVGRYLSVAQAMEEYKLTPEQINANRGKFINSPNSLAFNGVTGSYNGNNRQFLLPWIIDRDIIFCLDAYWLDTKYMYCKVITDKNGNEQVIRVSEENAKLKADEKENGGRIEKRQWGCVRQATLVGGDLIVNWGETPDQEYDVDNLQKAYLPLQMLMPNYVQGTSVSKVWELKNMQDAKNIAMWKIEHEMVKMGGMTIDTALIPKEWGQKGVKMAVYYAKVLGMRVINSMQEGNPAAAQQNGMPMGLSKDVYFYLEFIRKIDEMLSETSGTSQVAMGAIANNQLSSVTQAALLQSDKVVEIYYTLFEQFEQRLWTGQTRTIKIAYQQNPEYYKAVMGENIYAIIESMGKDIDLADYSVFIKVKPAMLRNRQIFDSTIQQMMTAGQLDPVIGLDLLTTADMDLDAAIRKFKKESKKNAAAAAKMNAMMAQQQAQMQQQMLDKKLQAEVEKSVAPAQINAQASLQKANLHLQGKAMSEQTKRAIQQNQHQFDMFMDVANSGQ